MAWIHSVRRLFFMQIVSDRWRLNDKKKQFQIILIKNKSKTYHSIRIVHILLHVYHNCSEYVLRVYIFYLYHGDQFYWLSKQENEEKYRSTLRFMKCNDIFNNILVISWCSVLLVEDTEVSEKNYRPVVSH